jgi:hypothetical protein
MFTPSPFAILLHIEHTGGMTMKDVLHRQYPRGGFYNAKRGKPFQHFIDSSPEQRGAYRAMIGHVYYGVHTLIPRPSVYHTWLRHPVERLLSTYHYFGRKPKAGLHQAYVSGELRFEEFIEMPWYTHVQLSRIVGVPSEQFTRLKVDNISPDSVEIAKQNLSDAFGVVGLTEHYDETLLLLAKALGWKQPPYYIRRNSHSKTNKADHIAPHLRHRIEQLAAPEIELYTWVHDRFQHHLKELGSGFQRELAEFREGNTHFNIRASRIERIKSPFRRILRRARKLMNRG